VKRLSRLQSIRIFCVQCMGGNTHCSTDCPAVKCKLYPYRLGKGGGSKGTVIRKYCLECVGSPSEVKNCTDLDCPLYPYRLRLGGNQGSAKKTSISRFSALDSTIRPDPMIYYSFQKKSRYGLLNAFIVIYRILGLIPDLYGIRYIILLTFYNF